MNIIKKMCLPLHSEWTGVSSFINRGSWAITFIQIHELFKLKRKVARGKCEQGERA